VKLRLRSGALLAVGIGVALMAGCATGGPAGRATAAAGACGSGAQLRLHVYDVGQAAAALVELPDGRAVLVDAGGHKTALAPKLQTDLTGRPISMVWITHPHDDHLSQMKAVLEHFKVEAYVDNGLDGGSPSAQGRPGGMGVRMRQAASASGAKVVSAVDGKLEVPLAPGPSVKFAPVAPLSWSSTCPGSSVNDCSLGLRIDYCDSSVLFLGDAEVSEEDDLPLRPATLLVVPHHGSKTSTSPRLLEQVRPRYAVISAGRGSQFCHPNGATVERLTAATGGPGDAAPVQVGGVSDKACGWAEAPRSSSLWVTAADGDVVLVTEGDGAFRRETKKAGP